MSKLGFGIVGTGMISGVIADAVNQSSKAKLVAVSSRRMENAKAFVVQRPGVTPVEGIHDLLNNLDVQAVYLGIPTIAKEEIALAAIAAGKHLLIDKPFLSHASAVRMSRAATAKGVAFMDATHFVHHPRTAAILAASDQLLGTPRSLYTNFYFPFTDHTNIRFVPDQEPLGAVGDMAWYSMRAIDTYLRPQGKITKAVATSVRHPITNGVIQVKGLIAFESGETSTFDAGYTADTLLMDLHLLGTKGVISMDDFVLDWGNSFPFQNADIPVGYTHRSKMANRKQAVFTATPSAIPQQVLMIDAFADLATQGTPAQRAAYIDASLKTQEYVDAIWKAANT